MSIQSEIDRIKNNVAETYSALEEQGATMPTQQNSANMAATARTIPTGGGSGTTVQADMAVNDPTNARYVKNRTHWKEEYDGPEGEIIPETSVAFTTNIKSITGAMSNGIQVGGKYIVTWDGTDYVCVGKTCSDGNYIGNASFMNAGSVSFADTGEPFLIQQFTGTYYMLWKADKTAATITVKVVGKKETVWHKLDKGYLDEALQFGSEVVEILPETTSEVVEEMEGAPIFDVLSVEVGKTYTVKWNGTEYVCTAQAPPSSAGISGAILGNSGAITGGALTEEPFIIVCFDADSAAEMGIGGLAAPLDGSASVTLSITSENVKKLDGKYLPNGVPYKEMGLVEILPEMTVEGGEEVPIMTEIELVEGNTYTVKWNGVEYTCVAHKWEMDGFTAGIVVGDYGLITMGAPVTGDPFIIADLSAEFSAEVGGVPTMLMCIDGSTSVTLSITNKAEVAHKIAGELLPEGVPYVEPFDDVIMAAWPSSIDSGGLFADPAGTLVAGNFYKVNWGGTIYECAVQEIPGFGMGLGNLSGLGGMVSPEPFGIFLLAPSMRAEAEATGIIVFVDPPENYEFSIIGGWKVQKIDKRCLPDIAEPWCIPITHEGNNVYSCDVSFKEVEKALSGEVPRIVYLVSPYQNQVSDIYKFEFHNGEVLWFSRMAFYGASSETFSVYLNLIKWNGTDGSITGITKTLL